MYCTNEIKFKLNRDIRLVVFFFFDFFILLSFFFWGGGGVGRMGRAWRSR